MHRADATVHVEDLEQLYRLVLERLPREGIRPKRHALERGEERGLSESLAPDIIEHGEPDWCAIRLADGRPALRIWADLRVRDEQGRVEVREAGVVVAMHPHRGIDLMTIMWRNAYYPSYPAATRRPVPVRSVREAALHAR